MDDVSRLLDGDLSPSELEALLARLAGDAQLRDEVTVQQLVRDAVAGVRALDDGYTLRILARLRAQRDAGR
jgi:negative regulator of sigma E activity